MSERLPLRLARDATFRVVATLSAGVALLLLAWILWTLVSRGASSLSTALLVTDTLPPGRGGGLRNAIIGSLIQVGMAVIIATPIGVLAGIFLAELGDRSLLGRVVRFINDVLLSAPSILIGLFVYQILVRPFGGFSGIAGAIALGIIILPVVVRATEDMLRLVPPALREAAFALGAPHWHVVANVTLRGARAGIVTGILLAIARAAGETAPLLFTSLGSLNWSVDLTKPMSSLPVTIYQYAGSPFDEWVGIAWAGALLITLGVLCLNIVSRLLLTLGRGK